MKPELPIEVDAETGIWTTDSLPMLYVPRHFFINNHLAVQDALGKEKYAEILYDAGYKSAYHWCEKESLQHGISGTDVFRHYLNRLSQRGWGQFKIIELDPHHSHAVIHLYNSCFVLEYGDDEDKRCYMFAGWFAGAMDWVNDTEHDLSLRGPAARSAESNCHGVESEYCIFTVSPII